MSPHPSVWHPNFDEALLLLSTCAPFVHSYDWFTDLKICRIDDRFELLNIESGSDRIGYFFYSTNVHNWQFVPEPKLKYHEAILYMLSRLLAVLQRQADKEYSETYPDPEDEPYPNWLSNRDQGVNKVFGLR